MGWSFRVRTMGLISSWTTSEGIPFLFACRPGSPDRAPSSIVMLGQLRRRAQPRCSSHVAGFSAAPFSRFREEQGSPRKRQSPTKPRATTTRASNTISSLVNSHHSWSPRLEAALAPLSSNLSKTTFLQTLHLIKNPAKSLLFFKWAHRRLSFPHIPQSYSAMINILTRTPNLNAPRNLLLSVPKLSCGSVALLDRFFNSLIRAYGCSGLVNESIKLFRSMKDHGVAPSATRLILSSRCSLAEGGLTRGRIAGFMYIQHSDKRVLS